MSLTKKQLKDIKNHPLFKFNFIKGRRRHLNKLERENREAAKAGMPEPHSNLWRFRLQSFGDAQVFRKKKPLAFVSRNTINSWKGICNKVDSDVVYFSIPGEVWDYFAQRNLFGE